MKATHVSGDQRRATRRHWAHHLLLMIPFSLALTPQASNAEQDDITAVLKLHEMSFTYRANTSVLSCSHIRGVVVSVLRNLGAREDLGVNVNGCDAIVSPYEDSSRDTWQDRSDPWGRQEDPWDTSSDRWESSQSSGSDRFGNRRMGSRQSAHVRIRAMMPVEATPEVLAEMQKDKSRRELLARVTGNPLNEPIVFPAERRIVELSHRTMKLEPEECELLDQMSRSVFKEVGLRVIRRPSCSRDRVSAIAPQLTVEALLPLMPTVPELSPKQQESK